MKRRILASILALLMALSLAACGADEEITVDALDLSAASWEEIVEAARGTTVTFYGWGGDENRNNWLNTTVADYVKENYDITLEVVGMNIDDILAKLSGEKQAGSAKAVNIVLMGRAAKYFDIPYERWIAAIENTVAPKFVEMNKVAFNLGFNA